VIEGGPLTFISDLSSFVWLFEGEGSDEEEREAFRKKKKGLTRGGARRRNLFLSGRSSFSKLNLKGRAKKEKNLPPVSKIVDSAHRPDC